MSGFAVKCVYTVRACICVCLCVCVQECMFEFSSVSNDLNDISHCGFNEDVNSSFGLNNMSGSATFYISDFWFFYFFNGD